MANTMRAPLNKIYPFLDLDTFTPKMIIVQTMEIITKTMIASIFQKLKYFEINGIYL